MLKLELSSQREEIQVRFRVKESVWTSTFISALVFTLAVHVTALLLVRVDADHSRAFELRTPLQVVAELGGESDVDERSSTSTGNREGLLPQYVLEPKAPLPILPELPQHPINQHLCATKRLEMPGRMFAQIDECNYQPDQLEISLPGALERPKITLSGAVAEATLLRDGSDILGSNELARLGNLRLQLHVGIDPPTGRVLWAQPVAPHSSEPAIYYAQKMALAMVFAKESGMFPIEGYVEVRFEGGSISEASE